jgi:hypothetical protein
MTDPYREPEKTTEPKETPLSRLLFIGFIVLPWALIVLAWIRFGFVVGFPLTMVYVFGAFLTGGINCDDYTRRGTAAITSWWWAFLLHQLALVLRRTWQAIVHWVRYGDQNQPQ